LIWELLMIICILLRVMEKYYFCLIKNKWFFIDCFFVVNNIIYLIYGNMLEYWNKYFMIK
jgi:hypothetical protein